MTREQARCADIAGDSMDIDGIKVTVTGDPYPGEIEGYVRRGLREHGRRKAVTA